MLLCHNSEWLLYRMGVAALQTDQVPGHSALELSPHSQKQRHCMLMSSSHSLFLRYLLCGNCKWPIVSHINFSYSSVCYSPRSSYCGHCSFYLCSIHPPKQHPSFPEAATNPHFPSPRPALCQLRDNYCISSPGRTAQLEFLPWRSEERLH